MCTVLCHSNYVSGSVCEDTELSPPLCTLCHHSQSREELDFAKQQIITDQLMFVRQTPPSKPVELKLLQVLKKEIFCLVQRCSLLVIE